MDEVDSKELSIVDEDIAKVFIEEFDRGYVSGRPAQFQIVRSLKEIVQLLRALVQEGQQSNNRSNRGGDDQNDVQPKDFRS